MQGRKKLLLCSSGLVLMLAQCPVFTGGMAFAIDNDEGANGGGDGAHTLAAVYIEDNSRLSDSDYEYDEDEGIVTLSIADGATGIDGTAVDGLLMTSDVYDANGIVVTGDSDYQVGGDEDYYTVYSDSSADYVGTTVQSVENSISQPGFHFPGQSGTHSWMQPGDPNKIGTFNTVILFTLDDDVDSDATTGSSGIDVDGDDDETYSTVHIDNTYIQMDGAKRYADSSYNYGKTIVNDSYFVSTGNASGYTDDIDEPFSNEALQISGTARVNFSVGATDTYYFNSTVIAEGWAALSTDSAVDDGLDLYAYNTTAKTLNGGYATYADTSCRVWLYGSDLEAAEIGAIASKTGAIHVLDGASADDDILQYDTGKKTLQGTLLEGGRNAVMLHAPDMMGEGVSAANTATLEVYNSTLKTSTDLVSTKDYSDYSDGVAAYVSYVTGDAILVKSTSADITLDKATVDSFNGVILHTVINGDSMGNWLAAGENESVDPVSLTMTDMQAKGDILHEDYQRDMDVVLSDASLEGAIVQGTFDSWVALWEDMGYALDDAETESYYWLPDSSWDGSNDLSVTLDGKSTWTVTETSTLSSLTLGDDAVIKGMKGQNVVMTVDDVETDIVPGTAYSGAIVLSLVQAPAPSLPMQHGGQMNHQNSMPGQTYSMR